MENFGSLTPLGVIALIMLSRYEKDLEPFSLASSSRVVLMRTRFNAAQVPEFQSMDDAASRHAPQVTPPYGE